MKSDRIIDRVKVGNIRNVETGVVHAPMSANDRVPLCGLHCRAVPWETLRPVDCKRCIANVEIRRRQASS